MGYKYVAISADGKDTLLASEKSLRELEQALGFCPNTAYYYYKTKRICKKLNARIFAYPEKHRSCAQKEVTFE